MHDLPAAFAETELWIFDLDNTLYPRPEKMWGYVDQRMTAFVSSLLEVDTVEAHRIQKDYLVRYGTTLKGLMLHHDVAPDDFLNDVHNVDLSEITPAPALAAAIEALPGRKIIHTNSHGWHVERVLARLEFPETLFSAVHTIETKGYESKPNPLAYDAVMGVEKTDPRKAAFFEDSARNLREPHRRGMRTIYVPSDCALASEGADEDYVEFVAPDLTGFLQQITNQQVSA